AGASTTPVPPSLRHRQSELMLLMGRVGECHFWSETWVAGDALLAKVVDRLRVVRCGRGIQVDDGWRPDRDVSVSVGAWGWAHVGGVVEDHGTGRCLFRTRLHIRMRPTAVLLQALIAAAFGWTLIRGADFLAVAVAIGAVALYVKMSRQVSRDVRQIV